jgi:hypothetical protein
MCFDVWGIVICSGDPKTVISCINCAAVRLARENGSSSKVTVIRVKEKENRAVDGRTSTTSLILSLEALFV